MLPKIRLGGSQQGAQTRAIADKLRPPQQPWLSDHTRLWMRQAAGDRGGSSHHRQVSVWAEQSYVSQTVGETIPASSISWFPEVIKTNFGA